MRIQTNLLSYHGPFLTCVIPVSHEAFEREVARLTEDFLADLTRAISKQQRQKENEWSIEEIAEEMKRVSAILNVLSQRWSLGMIFLLYMRDLKFNELRDLLQGISSRTLTDKLRMLGKHGILTRSVMSSGPVRVRYSLTTRGRAIALSSLPLLYHAHKHE
jgi:DNA-binding HxlR family transcriptional regulator